MKIGTSWKPIVVNNGFMETDTSSYHIVAINGSNCTICKRFKDNDGNPISREYAGYIVRVEHRGRDGELICYTWEVYAI